MYSVATNGAAEWSETHQDVTITNGIFVVELGSLNPLPDALLNFGALYLGISIDGGVELVPRMPVGSALQAQWSAQVSNLDGRDVNPNSISING